MKRGDILKVIAPDKTVRGSFTVDSVDPGERTVQAVGSLPERTGPGDEIVMVQECDEEL